MPPHRSLLPKIVVIVTIKVKMTIRRRLETGQSDNGLAYSSFVPCSADSRSLHTDVGGFACQHSQPIKTGASAIV